MKANYREMAKELSEIMHEQVCTESFKCFRICNNKENIYQ